MDTDVVEVVARFGATILDVRHVARDQTYRIGTAPGADLAVPGLTCFPLVDAGKVRCPVGLRSSERDGVTELLIGELSLTITRTKLPRVPIARPRIDRRPPVFIALSLVAHVALWLIAMTYAPFEQLPRGKPRLRLAHIADVPPPVEATKPLPRKELSAKATQPVQRAGVAHPARGGAAEATPRSTTETVRGSISEQLAAVTGRIGKQVDDAVKQVEQLRPEDTYNEDEANASGFGGGRRFDPTTREDFKSIEVGKYAVFPFNVKLCPEKSCTVEGPIPALYVRTHLHAHMDAIYDCYMHYAEGPGTIVLEFTITPDGAVRDARGSGLGETGACAARVASEIYFKALGLDHHPPASTHVRYPLRFNPNRG